MGSAEDAESFSAKGYRLSLVSAFACHSVPRDPSRLFSIAQRRDRYPVWPSGYRTATSSGTRAGRTRLSRTEPNTPLDRRFRRATRRPPGRQDRAPSKASLTARYRRTARYRERLSSLSDARLSTKADSKIVVERLLSVSGEDSLTIDRKYREPWTGRLPTRFVIMSNELPRLSDSSGALASRFILFVLTKSFYGARTRSSPANCWRRRPRFSTGRSKGLTA
jgi:Family of unknown function (DUF5906)